MSAEECVDVREIILDNPGLGRRLLSRKYPDVPESVFRRVLRQLAEEAMLDEVNEEDIVKLQRQKQGAMDRARLANKLTRDDNRKANCVIELNERFEELFNRIDLPAKIHREFPPQGKKSIVINVSDLHAQELINESFNQYSPTILGKRFRKLAHKALKIANDNDASEVVVIATGDLINSDRRLSEITSAATNRTRATFMVASIFEQFINDIYADYPVRVAFVFGNESRVDSEFGFDDFLLSDNFDYSIYNILKIMFRNSDVVFEDGRGAEQVVNVRTKKILALHGNEKGFGQNPTNGVMKKIAQYALDGIVIDYLIFGHLHGCLISDRFARSGSVCGGNAYSTLDLGFPTSASQNVFVVDSESINGTRIDLQQHDGYEPYHVDPNILKWNPA